MKNGRIKAATLSVLCALFVMNVTACNAGKVKVTFVTEENSDIFRYVKKGKTLVEIPEVPSVKGKYCFWEREDFTNLKEDITVKALCYSTVVKLDTNIPSEIEVDVSSEKSSLEHILNDVEMEVTFENGEKKKIYPSDFVIDSEGYNPDVAGSYTIKVGYNNLKKDVTIKVNKIKDYLSVYLDNTYGYFNEGLPNLMTNTDVEGQIKFDEGQTLSIGNRDYSWTFTPVNTDKYEILKGTISVNLISPNLISLNKNEISVPFGTTENQIIEIIKDGLFVEGKFGENEYREIEEQYYDIEYAPTDNKNIFMVNKSDEFLFRVVYDRKKLNNNEINPLIRVKVEQNYNYDLNVAPIKHYLKTDNLTLQSVKLVATTKIPGNIEFDETATTLKQELTEGKKQFNYIFTPSDTNYGIKKGFVIVDVYKASDIECVFTKKYEYGKIANEIIGSITSQIEGAINIIYNEEIKEEVLNIEEIDIEILGVNENEVLNPGKYTVKISYSGKGKIEKEYDIEVKKIQLVKGVDFEISPQEPEISNYTDFPQCEITIKDTSRYKSLLESSQFQIVPIPESNPIKVSDDPLAYEYEVRIEPIGHAVNIFEPMVIKLIAYIK